MSSCVKAENTGSKYCNYMARDVFTSTIWQAEAPQGCKSCLGIMLCFGIILYITRSTIRGSKESEYKDPKFKVRVVYLWLHTTMTN